MRRSPAIKICCILDPAEAALAIAAGADALGLVSSMPSGPGVISDDQIARIVAGLPGGIDSFLLSSRSEVDGLVAQQRYTQANTLQLVRHLPVETLRGLRCALPEVRLVQVIHVPEEDAIEHARRAAEVVDALLLDSGSPAQGVLGGTGKAHDWQRSRKIVAAVSLPVYLAGGLRPGNVRAALAQVGPYGLDLCTGVRREGRLDPGLLRDFVSAARQHSPGT